MSSIRRRVQECAPTGPQGYGRIGAWHPGEGTSTYTYTGVGALEEKTTSAGSNMYRRAGVGVTAPVLGDGAASDLGLPPVDQGEEVRGVAGHVLVVGCAE